jgi:hypothetical protein
MYFLIGNLLFIYIVKLFACLLAHFFSIFVNFFSQSSYWYVSYSAS